MNVFETVIYAFVAGLIPALIWLWFWLHEDSSHPEPRGRIAFTFLSGMVMIFIAIPFEAFFADTNSTLLKFFIWASIEELLKFFAAYIVAIHSKAYDEPLDAVVYMMCAALGFAALENTLFILNNTISVVPVSVSSEIINTVFLSNLRFIGANLLHMITSSSIGIAMALSFYKPRLVKFYWTLGGIIAAILLHTVFNLIIMNGTSSSIFLVFSLVWLTMIGFALVFERIKQLKIS